MDRVEDVAQPACIAHGLLSFLTILVLAEGPYTFANTVLQAVAAVGIGTGSAYLVTRFLPAKSSIAMRKRAAAIVARAEAIHGTVAAVAFVAAAMAFTAFPWSDLSVAALAGIVTLCAWSAAVGFFMFREGSRRG